MQRLKLSQEALLADKGRLAALLRYHIVPGRAFGNTSDLLAARTLVTLSEQTLVAAPTRCVATHLEH